jgi:uncharacterized protein (TIGR02145 family)
MKKIIVAAIGLVTLATLNGQAVEQRLPVAEEISNRRTPFNLEEIKVRWKKAALENCTGVPCTTTGPGTGGSFTCGTSTVADIDGNTYNTVLIGTQCWTKSNLKVSKYNDGTAIPLDASGGSTGFGAGETWSTRTAGAYCILDNEPSTGTNASNLGFLYNWDAATDPKKICPAGWHVPSEEEWKILISYLGGSGIAGGKMKSTIGWNAPNTGATNESGFSALPGGYRFTDGSFYDIRDHAFFWSATEIDYNLAWYRDLYNFNGEVNRFIYIYYSKSVGASVRCIRD